MINKRICYLLSRRKMKINNFIRIFPFIVLFTPNRKFKKSKIKKRAVIAKNLSNSLQK